MDDFLSGVIFGILGLVIGFILGVIGNEGTWTGDCDTLGMHRVKQASYICHKKP